MFAVDEGILQVARYKLGDPLKFFFRKRMLEVGTSQILDLILPDFEKLMAMAAPGGDADDAIGRQLNPFKRKRDKPVVYWSGIVDVNGDTRLSYTVPDYFNGKLRVMAVSVSPDLGTFEGRRRCAAISCCRRMCRRHSRRVTRPTSASVSRTT